MHKILVIRLYFLLDALHVSDYISPSSGATSISCISCLVYADTTRLAVLWLQPHNSKTYRHIPAYTKCDVRLIEVAPDDGLIQSETCRASNKNKVYSQEFCASCWFIYIL